MKSIVLAMAFLCAGFSSTAEAKRHKHLVQTTQCTFFCDNPAIMAPSPEEGRKRHPYKATPRPHFGGVGGRPRRWCGWYMQTKTGVTSKVTGRNLNMAREWAHVGSPASPAPGVVVVWRHHVGQIVGKDERGRWLVHSGNDGNAIRTRARSISNAIAFRAL